MTLSKVILFARHGICEFTTQVSAFTVGDDLIGETFIDVEDRWFSQTWKKLDPKPLERRTLKIPQANAPQVREPWIYNLLIDMRSHLALSEYSGRYSMPVKLKHEIQAR